MNQVVYRIAATAFVVGLTTVGCAQSIQTAGRPAAAASQRAERDALKLHDQAYAPPPRPGRCASRPARLRRRGADR